MLKFTFFTITEIKVIIYILLRYQYSFAYNIWKMVVCGQFLVVNKAYTYALAYV